MVIARIGVETSQLLSGLFAARALGEVGSLGLRAVIYCADKVTPQVAQPLLNLLRSVTQDQASKSLAEIAKPMGALLGAALVCNEIANRLMQRSPSKSFVNKAYEFVLVATPFQVSEDSSFSRFRELLPQTR